MKDKHDYKYDDPDYIYTDSKTKVLRNRLGIADDDTLLKTEGILSAQRLEELHDKPLKVKDASSLLDIHKHLFQDLYEWAGMVRKANIRKQGKPFLPVSSFSEGFEYVSSLLNDYRDAGNERNIVAKHLAKILDSVNYLHPFREGNGRTQREFVRVLALEKGYDLNLNPIGDASVYDRYMTGTINGDVQMLTSLIRDILVEM